MFPNMRLTGVLIIFLLLPLGCTKRGPYRVTLPGAAGARASEDTRVIEAHDGFKVGFVEFGDDGKRLLARKQLDAVVQELRTARGLELTTGKVLPGTVGGITVIYAHGWKNNAQSIAGRRKDVEKFRDFLKGIAEELEPAGKTALPITGVYLGWHGKSVNIDSGLLNWWTLWPRYFAAGNVGSEELQRTVAQLIQAGIAGRATLGEEKRPRVILIGHSLGARVLQSALERVRGADALSVAEEEDPKYGLLLGQCKNLNDGKDVKSAVDLTLLVNEATKSRRVRKATKLCLPDPPKDAMVRHPAYRAQLCQAGSESQLCRPYPLFVHIASSADWATRFLAPVALLGRTAPHSAELWTHRVQQVAAGSPPAGKPLFSFTTQEPDARTYAVTQASGVSERDPIWVMRVDGHVVKNHGDIWNENFQNMIKALMGGLEVVQLKSFSPATRVYKK